MAERFSELPYLYSRLEKESFSRLLYMVPIGTVVGSVGIALGISANQFMHGDRTYYEYFRNTAFLPELAALAITDIGALFGRIKHGRQIGRILTDITQIEGRELTDPQREEELAPYVTDLARVAYSEDPNLVIFDEYTPIRFKFSHLSNNTQKQITERALRLAEQYHLVIGSFEIRGLRPFSRHLMRSFTEIRRRLTFFKEKDSQS